MSAASQDSDEKIQVTKLQIKSAQVDKHVDWLVRAMMASVESSAVLSAEIVPPSATESEWTLVQRFNNEELQDAWLKSAARQKLLTEYKAELESSGSSLSESTASTFGTVGSVAVAVVTHVKPGQEAAYCACESKYQTLQAQYPGYRGAYVQPPTPHTPGLWTTLIRFDSAKTMDAWFQSEERKKLLNESDQLVSSTAYQSVNTSFPGWFPDDKQGGKGPPNWKAAMLILLGLYPIVMVEIKFLNPILHPLLPAAAANFVGNILSVMGTTWVTMPLAIKLYSPWLFPTENTPKWVAPVSIVSLVCIYAVEIALLWRLL